jgi:alkylation response protein AidB-like acyl-CoA dehydrogenase
MASIIALQPQGARPKGRDNPWGTIRGSGNYNSGMDFQLPDADDPRRVAVRHWLDDHPNPTGKQLAEAGYVAAQWPAPWGLGADPIHQLIIDDELSKAKVRRPVNPIGIGWAGPTLLYAGTEKQQQQYLPPMLSGEEFWCQLFSESGSGSDLASLGTRAVRDGDEFVVNGQKIWTSGAQHAAFGILLARTDPDVPKHKGISYFVCPMNVPGIDIRPITEMTGGHTFNEVFFTDVRIPAQNVVGELNDGWRLAKITLGNERVSLSTGGVLWGNGPTALELIESITDRGPVTDPNMRQRIADIYTEHRLLDLIRLRTLTATLKGQQPGPEASVRKILADEHGQHVMALARDYVGAAAMLTGGDGLHDFVPGTDTKGLGTDKPEGGLLHPGWYDGFLFSQALTIGGGTGDVQRNIVGERVLGLPRDVDVTTGMSWAESQRAGARV